MPRNYDLMESIRQKASMSAQIVATKDSEYAQYSGGSYEIGMKLANIATFLESNLLPEKLVPLIKLYRLYLQHRRKAFFATVGCTEISKLGFILGVDVESVADEEEPKP